MTGRPAPMTRAEAAALLGLDRDADAAEVQRAFLRGARHAHPDTLPEAGDADRRAAEDRFDRLVRAREVLLTTAAGTVPPEEPPASGLRPRSSGIAGSLVVLALLAFLLVLLVTVQQGLSGDPIDPGGVPAGSSSSPS